MPLITVQTSVPQPDAEHVRKLLVELSAQLAKLLGKPESYVMTAFETNPAMTFGGSFEPCCYIEIKSVGSMTPDRTQSMSKAFCQAIQSHLAVPPNRTYIEFADAKGSMWGWNGGTF